MNQRNVEALADILHALEITGNESRAREFAARIASFGVLVPSALTDNECETAMVDEVVSAEWNERTDRNPPDFRKALEWIARGEPLWDKPADPNDAWAVTSDGPA